MTASPEKSVSPAYGKLRYLVVDDFENFRLSIRNMLRGFGANKVELCSNGAETIQRCTYEHFDVVLCDYNLGKGKNGQHILEELRHRKLLKRSSLFIMVTAETSRDMVMGAREYQPDAYLTKPINQAMLSERLGSLIQQRQALLPINHEIDQENLPDAISLCIQMLPKLPRYKSWILKTLADLYYRIGDYSHARKIYEDMLAQRDIAWARHGLGKVLVAEQQYEKAVTELEGLIASNPDYLEAYDTLAEALSHLGKMKQAQALLEKSAELSPNALLRQKNLASIASANQDIDTATEAWRRTVNLGSYSVHDSADHYLALGRSLSDLSEGDPTEVGHKQADEALKIIKKMEKRFPESEDIGTKSLLIQSRVHAGQGRNTEAVQCLEQVTREVDADSVSVEVGLELAKSMFRLDRIKQAQDLLGKMARRFEGDNSVVQQIENLLDEPVGFKQKLQARALNREGIKAFEAGHLDEAAKAFEKALAIVPAHAALNLNLVQVRMKQIAQDGPKTPLINQCRECLSALENLPQQHQQYRRLSTLTKKLESLSHA